MRKEGCCWNSQEAPTFNACVEIDQPAKDMEKERQAKVE